MEINSDSFNVLRPGRLFCWLSGWTQSFKPDNWWAPWRMQVAHIASGQGRALRVDDIRAVIVLCPLAHDCHVSDSDRLPTKTIGGVIYPTIDERHTMWIKQKIDPENYDLDFLAKIWHGVPPQPERPPERWMQEMYKNQGIML